MNKFQLNLWRRRIETEFLSGRSPEQTLELLRQIVRDHIVLTENEPGVAIEAALARYAKEEGMDREEALMFIARDWLVGHGYLVSDDDGKQTA